MIYWVINIKIIKNLHDALQDIDALINIYHDEICINQKTTLISVSMTNIKLASKDFLLNIDGNNLTVNELSNITKISGNINHVSYENQELSN